MTESSAVPVRPKRNIRDSIFKAILKKPGYLKRIYLSLYPDEMAIKDDELKLLHAENVFIGSVIHDSAFSVRNEKVVFIEVQSTPCRLLPERMIRYWANIIPRLNPDWDGMQYSACGISLPFPEFWSVYVGRNAEKQPQFYFLGGKDDVRIEKLHVPVSVITRYNGRGILQEYCLFSQIYLENLIMCRDAVETVRRTLEECIGKGILADFLMDNGREVADIMGKSNDYYYDKYVESMNRIAEAKGLSEGMTKGITKGITIGRNEGITIGRNEGITKGRTETMEKVGDALIKEGFSPEQVSRVISSVKFTE